ncbi:MAG: dephospho-CoA kinase [Clostridia bacterium]|nr:dephospho-CoA kinase [Clostridia bacterium]
MKIIGITGKSGSGKSTLTTLLSQKLKCESINIDKIGHQATSDEKISQKLCEVFGKGILDNSGKVDRKKLGNIVFSDKGKMDQLTQITWGYMQKILDSKLKQTPKIIILEWALLPVDGKYWDKCNIKILMKADDKERKNKVMQRDKISEEYFLKRDLRSMDYSQFVFDYIFENDYTLETMDKIVMKLSQRGEE